MFIPDIDTLLLGALRSYSASSGEIRFLTLLGCILVGTFVQMMAFKVLAGAVLEAKNWAGFVVAVPMLVMAYWVYWLGLRTLPHFH